MQLIRIAALFTLFALSLASCANTQIKSNDTTCQSCAASPKFDQTCPLITSPCSRAKISEVNKVLDNLFATGKPIVLYVHGRGNEPKKTWEEGIAKTLEKDYGIKVMMFNWDSKAPLLNPLYRPVNKAYEAAPFLQEVIEKLARYRESHPDSKAIPVSLLVHSMGNIAFRKAVDGISLTTTDGPLFTNILMTGSDEDAEGHNVWIDKLLASGTILITINEADSTLSHSHHPDGKTPLGINPKPPLADHSYYLDATGLVGKTHRLFTKGKQHGRVGICHVLTAMLRGEKPNLMVGQDIRQVKHDRVLVPIEQQDKANECFQGVQDEPDEEGEHLDE